MAICYSNVVNSYAAILIHGQPVGLHLPLVKPDWLK